MEFETKLSSEAIKQRLITFTRSLNTLSLLCEHQFISKWNKNNTFYLLKTGGFISMRPVLPFVGKVEIRNDSTYIVGKFNLAKSAKVMLTCFLGLAWSMALFGCFLNSNFDIFGKSLIFVVYAIWTILGYLFFRFFPSLFQKKQQADVIGFIKQHLLQ